MSTNTSERSHSKALLNPVPTVKKKKMSASQDTFQSSQSIEVDMPAMSPLTSPHSKHAYQKAQYYHQTPHQSRSDPRDANFSAATLASSPPTADVPKTPAPAVQHSTTASLVKLPPLGNPTPLGLSAFGLTAFCVGLYNLRAGGLTEDAPAGFLIATTLFYGGMGQVRKKKDCTEGFFFVAACPLCAFIVPSAF